MIGAATATGRAAGSRERPVASVPPAVRWMLAAALALQVGWHAWRPDPRSEAQLLGPVPAATTLQVAAAGDRAAFAKLLMLRLLVHDRQPGTSIPFMHLDYERVAGWLDAIIDLDPRADAPLLAAARLYGSVSDPGRQRTMFALVHRRFLEDPDRRWPWLAHAAVMAKHRLGDPALALRYAHAVTEHATGPHVPAWVRDMSALIAADPAVLPRLESIVHPIVRRRQERFLQAAALRRAPAVALDIPLLFETGGERRCDTVLVVSAPAFVQRARVLARPEMTAEKLALILARQMPDAEKCRRADFVIPSHRGWRAMLDSLRRAAARTLERPARHWPPNPRMAPPRPAGIRPTGVRHA